MDIYAMIDKRKSCRNYTGRPLGEEKLLEIGDVINGLAPLYPDVALE